MAYPYDPLDSENREIRLLTVQPWKHSCDDPLDLALEHFQLERAPPFVALSYTWGDPDPRFTVALDGIDFEIRENLYTAIRRFRSADEAWRLWVDAVCINQDDVPERGSQVAIMRHIYSSAERVLAWVGEPSGDGDVRAMKFLNRLVLRIIPFAKVNEDDAAAAAESRIFEPSFELDESNKDAVDLVKSMTPPGFAGSPWLDVIHLLERPWFTRIWIVQEVVMGKFVEIHCGSESIYMEHLHQASAFIRVYIGAIREIAAPCSLPRTDPSAYLFYLQFRPITRLYKANESLYIIGHYKARFMAPKWRERATELLRLLGVEHLQESELTIDRLRQDSSRALGKFSRATDSGVSDDVLEALRQAFFRMKDSRASRPEEVAWNGSLYDLVRSFRFFDATDPRDKVFALLGIAELAESIPRVPPICYELDTCEAFWNLISTNHNNGERLDYLEDACGVDRPEGFPSWMPLWYEPRDGPRSRRSPLRSFQLAPDILYCASADRWHAVTGDFAQKMIKIRGARLGCIDTITDAYDINLSRADADADWSRIASILADAAKIMGIYEMLTALDNSSQLGEQETNERVQGWHRDRPDEIKRLAQWSAIRTLSVGCIPRSALSSMTMETPEFSIANGVYSGIPAERIARSLEDLRVVNAWSGRRFFRSRSPSGTYNYGLCPEEAEPGDQVAFLLGGDVLYIIREEGESGGTPTYGFVGEAYVQGAMSGEILELLKQEGDGPDDLNCEVIQLV